MANVDEALKYLEHNMSIIPVGKDKRPLIPWLPFQEKRASADQVKSWWRGHPDANIGIITGEISGIDVVDCDSAEAIAWFEENYKGETPCVKTPKGRHYYFKHEEGVRNTVRVKGLAIDVRGSGGYVVAPPSVNEAGLSYAFIKDLSFALDSLRSFIYFFSLYRESVTKSEIVSGSQLESAVVFKEGRRDEDIFHVANSLVKGNCNPVITQEVLRIIANNCVPPYPEKDIEVKIKSALDRVSRKERNIAHEIDTWLESVDSHFLVSDYYLESAVVSPKDKHAAIVYFRKLADLKKIESIPTKRGQYRKINQDVEVIDWKNAQDKEYPIRWPLGLDELVKLYPGNVVVLAGASNTGKTSWCLELIRLNQEKHTVSYFNSEMAAAELRLRLAMFSKDVITLDKWNFRAVERSSNFADVIDPEGFNIIDFMEVYDDFWKVGGWIRDIHARLKNGIAVIMIQKKSSTKKEQQKYARGGELTIEKPRLYLAMDRGRLEIVKAKIWRDHDRNPNGLVRRFKLVGGWKFLPEGKWEDAKEERYSGFTQE